MILCFYLIYEEKSLDKSDSFDGSIDFFEGRVDGVVAIKKLRIWSFNEKGTKSNPTYKFVA